MKGRTSASTFLRLMQELGEGVHDCGWFCGWVSVERNDDGSYTSQWTTHEDEHVTATGEKAYRLTVTPEKEFRHCVAHVWMGIIRDVEGQAECRDFIENAIRSAIRKKTRRSWFSWLFFKK